LWRLNRELGQHLGNNSIIKPADCMKDNSGPDDEIKFDRAWKNGVWHCLAPVSFDLASPESIREKAHKWLGQLASVGSDDLKLYFLVGEPSQAELKPVYQSALNILRKSTVPVEVFAETDAFDLSRRLAAQVAKHDAAASVL